MTSSLKTPSEEELRAQLVAMAGGDESALASLVAMAGPWLLPVAQRLRGGDSDEAASLCEQLFVHVWQQSPCYDSNLGPPMAWMLLLLRELAKVSDRSCSEPTWEDSASLARVWFGEDGGDSGD